MNWILNENRNIGYKKWKRIESCYILAGAEKSRKQEKKAGTNFVLWSQSSNMIGRFMKAYFHRPIKSLQSLTTVKSQNT